jgi:hypothetical protein
MKDRRMDADERHYAAAARFVASVDKLRAAHAASVRINGDSRLYGRNPIVYVDADGGVHYTPRPGY